MQLWTEREVVPHMAMAWFLAVGALCLSVSGWFTVVGLGLAVLAIVFAKITRDRGPLIVAVLALCASILWLVIDRVVA